jgi:uncharacterized protein (DUF427 family)
VSTASEQPVTDYPQMAAARGRIEPAPRRVRGFLGSQLVFDTTSARYVWEVPYYPQYYVPLADVRGELLRDEDHPQHVQFGASRMFTLAGESQTHTSAARVFDDGDGPVAGLVRFDWAALTWFEEDEPIYGHPRNPYARVDALRSHRHVRVELDGVLLADTDSPVLLFETGLPTRYYIDRTDVAFEHLELSDTQTLCPYKGVTSEYGSVRVGETLVELEHANDEIHKLPITDELTGLNNRRGFYLRSETALHAARRQGSTCLLVFLDVDGLKTGQRRAGTRCGGQPAGRCRRPTAGHAARVRRPGPHRRRRVLCPDHRTRLRSGGVAKSPPRCLRSVQRGEQPDVRTVGQYRPGAGTTVGHPNDRPTARARRWADVRGEEGQAQFAAPRLILSRR